MIICRKGLCVHKIIKPRLFVALLVKTIWSFLNQMKNIDLIESFLHYINLNNLTKILQSINERALQKSQDLFVYIFIFWNGIPSLVCRGTIPVTVLSPEAFAICRRREGRCFAGSSLRCIFWCAHSPAAVPAALRSLLRHGHCTGLGASYIWSIHLSWET